MVPTPVDYFWLSLPVLLVGAWQFFRKPFATPLNIGHLPATEGAKLLREWCTWLATLATGAIGVAAFLPTATMRGGVCDRPSVLGSLAITSFGLAIIFTATLLLALPSLVARFNTSTPSPANDFYESTAFAWAEGWLGPLFRVGFLAFAQYYYFVAGVIGFATCAASTVAKSN